MGSRRVARSLRALRAWWLAPPDVERARLAGDVVALAAAMRYLDDDFTCEAAAAALAESGEAGVEALRHALLASDPRVRATAANNLARASWQEFDETSRASAGWRLIDVALRDLDPDVRSAAARALGRVGGVGAVEALRAASTDPVERVRLSAVSALGRLLPYTIRQWEFEPPDPGWTTRHPPAQPSPAPPDLAPSASPAPPDQTPSDAPAQTGARIRMVVCPRCQRLSSPRFVRCHRCGARLGA